MAAPRTIEVRVFKWPRRPTAIAATRLLGEDEFGRWLAVADGDPWKSADGSVSGTFETSLVKVAASGAWWTACFSLTDPVVDVDIVLPVRWREGALEEIDLELDVLRTADGKVRVRDRDEFNRVRDEWAMPGDVAVRAEEACERLRELVAAGTEPFGEIGRLWLSRFSTEAGTPRTSPG